LASNFLAATPAAQTQSRKSGEASVERSNFGTLDDGTVIESFTLRNAKGAMARVITYGATLTELRVPDRKGELDDVVLGFDNLESYRGPHPHFGGTIGRYANRIAKGRFTLDEMRSEEHTSELQSRGHLVCRLLLEKKKQKPSNNPTILDNTQRPSHT